MKDFASAEYVNPVLDWFGAAYRPIMDKTVLDALRCDLLLQCNYTRDAKAVRKDDVFYTSCPPAREVHNEIRDYAKIASIEEGDLDEWMWNEEQCFQNAVRDRLLAEYT